MLLRHRFGSMDVSSARHSKRAEVFNPFVVTSFEYRQAFYTRKYLRSISSCLDPIFDAIDKVRLIK